MVTSDFIGYNSFGHAEFDTKRSELGEEDLRDRLSPQPDLQAARRLNPEFRFVASPWTPPPWMKTTRRALRRGFAAVGVPSSLRRLPGAFHRGVPRGRDRDPRRHDPKRTRIRTGGIGELSLDGDPAAGLHPRPSGSLDRGARDTDRARVAGLGRIRRPARTTIDAPASTGRSSHREPKEGRRVPRQRHACR